MKVSILLDSTRFLLEGISIDDKCLPIVAGVHPFQAEEKDSSPLVQEAALWFKTLSLDTVFIDCNQRQIYWTPAAADSTTAGDLQEQLLDSSSSGGFIPANARPLFPDSQLYAFDASLTDMMGQCCELTHKLVGNLIAQAEFNRNLVKILHVYILPSIKFSDRDLASLSQAQMLIEMRLNQIESDMRNKATLTENLRKCLDKYEHKLMTRENFESESYLRTCKEDFLEVFLRRVESQIGALNLNLSAVQNRVNWAKERPDDPVFLADLKERRDCLFSDVDKHIQIREAIKNVVSRRALRKKKVKKASKMPNNCIHNIFTETVKTLEDEDHILRQFGSDKVAICAAREAVLSAISSLTRTLSHSDSTTQFDPEKFVDYSIHQVTSFHKSDSWLTFQERVSKALKDTFSEAYLCHEQGCRNLLSEIGNILSHFQRDKPESSEDIFQDCLDGQFAEAASDISLRLLAPRRKESSRRNAVLTDEGVWVVYDMQPAVDPLENDSPQSSQPSGFVGGDETCDYYVVNSKVISTSDLGPLKVTRPYFRRKCIFSDDRVCSISQTTNSKMLGVDSECSGEIAHSRQQDTNHQRTISQCIEIIDELKVELQSHFTEVIGHLEQQLYAEEDKSLVGERQSLLQKSYERIFCQELYVPLLQLYTEVFSPGIRQTQAKISQISLQEILQGDRLLDVVFGYSASPNKSAPIDVPKQNNYPDSGRQPWTSSVDAVCYDFMGLNSPLPADGLHIDFDDVSVDGSSEITMKTTRSDSSPSAVYSVDEGFEGDSCFSNSYQSAVSSSCYERDIVSEIDKLQIEENDRLEENLKPALSPFKRLIRKCLNASCFMDKMRFVTAAIEGLIKDISQLFGLNFHCSSDDILSMLILALCNIPQEMFVGLYVNLRLLLDVLQNFTGTSRWEFNLVSLYSSYDYLSTLNIHDHIVK